MPFINRNKTDFKCLKAYVNEIDNTQQKNEKSFF